MNFFSEFPSSNVWAIKNYLSSKQISISSIFTRHFTDAVNLHSCMSPENYSQ